MCGFKRAVTPCITLALQDLWVELSGAAGACYVAAGRRRVAALMRAEVAEVLVARGLVARAAALVEQQCRLFLAEGWPRLAAALLPRLIACQKSLMQVPHVSLPL